LNQPLRSSTRVFGGVHLIEHFTLSNGVRLLRECFRIMKSGGTLRLATPDVGRMLALYTAEPSEAQKRYADWINLKLIGNAIGYMPPLILNNMFYNWGHRFIYDRNMLALALQQAGFTDIAIRPVGQSPDPHLAGIEGHGRVTGEPELVEYETMVLEARRP
jgi:hypothetical protein